MLLLVSIKDLRTLTDPAGASVSGLVFCLPVPPSSLPHCCCLKGWGGGWRRARPSRSPGHRGEASLEGAGGAAILLRPLPGAPSPCSLRPLPSLGGGGKQRGSKSGWAAAGTCCVLPGGSSGGGGVPPRSWEGALRTRTVFKVGRSLAFHESIDQPSLHLILAHRAEPRSDHTHFTEAQSGPGKGRGFA